MRPILGGHGTVEDNELRGIHEVRQQRGDIAVADKNLGMSFDLGELEMLEQIICAITTSGTQDGANVVTLEHLLEFAGAASGRSGEVEIALENGVEIKRSVSGAGEGGAAGFEIRLLDITGRRDNPDGIAGAKRRGLDGLGIRSRH